jgi:hypothetical protein
MCFKQLPRIVVDFHFSHGVISLLFRRELGGPGTVDIDTCHNLHPGAPHSQGPFQGMGGQD